MTVRYQYDMLHRAQGMAPEELARELNKRGRDGWELVTALQMESGGHYLIFKMRQGLFVET